MAFSNYKESWLTFDLSAQVALWGCKHISLEFRGSIDVGFHMEHNINMTIVLVSHDQMSSVPYWLKLLKIFGLWN